MVAKVATVAAVEKDVGVRVSRSKNAAVGQAYYLRYVSSSVFWLRVDETRSVSVSVSCVRAVRRPS